LLTLGLSLPAAAQSKITHAPPEAQANADLVIKAKIVAAGGVLEPSLYFRKKNGPYTRVAMEARANNMYEAKIPAAFLAGSDFIEYYLGAFSAKDLSEIFWRSKNIPFRLNIKTGVNHMLRVSTEPSNAIIDVDGVTVGPSPYSAPLTGGPHRLSARLTGYVRLDFDFNMPKERDLDLPLSLEAEHQAADATPAHPASPGASAPGAAPAAAGTGHVRIQSMPPGAAVQIDGRDVGVTPVDVDLQPSSYLISAKLASYQDETRIIKVAAGNTTDQVIQLRPKAGQPQ
jgi:hypothetical protein